MKTTRNLNEREIMKTTRNLNEREMQLSLSENELKALRETLERAKSAGLVASEHLSRIEMLIYMIKPISDTELSNPLERLL
jgi:hypothetical protein